MFSGGIEMEHWRELGLRRLRATTPVYTNINIFRLY